MLYELKTVAITKDDDPARSAAFVFEYWAMFIGIEVPDMDNGILYLDMADASGSYQPILDPTDGRDAVICDSTYDPGFIDITDWVRFVPPIRELALRCSTVQTTATVTLTIFMRG